MGVDLFPGPQYWGGGCGLIPRPSVLGMGVVSSSPQYWGWVWSLPSPQYWGGCGLFPALSTGGGCGLILSVSSRTIFQGS